MHVTSRRNPIALLALGVGVLVAACAGDELPADPDLGEATDDTDGVDEPTTDDLDASGDDDAAERTATDEDLTIVATTSILGDIAEHLVGDDGEVTVLMDAGVDPHGYQPSAADVALLREADLVIANGLMLEENLVAALDAAEEDGVRILEIADHLDPIDFDADGHGHSHDDDAGDAHEDEDDHGHSHDDEADEHGHDDDGGHDHGPEDPHVWFDPVRMADGVELMAAELSEVHPSIGPDEWQARADAYTGELLAVHEEMEAMFADIPDERRKLVTNHDSLGYLAHRYDLEVIGTVVPGSSTQAEADARAFAELIEAVEDAGVEVVFAENTDSTVLAEQLASEVVDRGDLDIEVVRIYSDALGEEGSGAETYLGMLRTTSQLIADALG